MGFENLVAGITPEQKRENYEKDASIRAEKESTFIKKIIGKGLTQGDIILVDAEEEDKYRNLLKEGRINEDEFKILTTLDLRKSEKFNVLLSRRTVSIDGVAHGNQISVVNEVDTPMTDGGMYSSHEAEVNGYEISASDAEIIFRDLVMDIEKRDAILERIKVDISEITKLNPEQKRENYEKDASIRAEKESTFIKKIIGKGLSQSDIILADAEEENKYRELLRNGKISEDEFECLTTLDLRKSEKFNVLLSRRTVSIDGVAHGNQINVVNEVDTPMTDGGMYSSHEAEVNGYEISASDAEIIFRDLVMDIEKRDAILERIKANDINE